MVVIGVGSAFALLFHIMVSESSQYVELKETEAETENQVERERVNLQTEQRPIRGWLTLKRFYLVSW